MKENIDLKTIEEKILKTGHQHGLFDLLIGFIVAGMAFGPIFRESLPEPYRYFLWPLILVIIAQILAFIIIKYVIQPRTGIVKPGPSLKSTRKKLLIFTSIHFVFLLIIFILPFTGIASGIKVTGIVFILIIGLFFMPFFITIAYLLKYPRAYVIGILIWMAIIINELMYDPIDYRIRWLLSYGVIGLIIFFMGLVIFVRFLKKYPLPKEELA
ncbi:MAG: hypothetical protein JSV23_08020 [Promethearchaeota archaeon]|nr:MAG: hypothetical protein JSV23_08020 [Candidatus Lokiarchaeota archaeon]